MMVKHKRQKLKQREGYKHTSINRQSVYKTVQLNANPSVSELFVEHLSI